LPAPGRVEVDLPVGLKRRLEEHARATSASTAGVIYAALTLYLGDDEADPVIAWSVLAREAESVKGRRRPVLSLTALSELIGSAKMSALIRQYGGARLPTLGALVSARRKEGIVAAWRNEGRHPRVIASWFMVSPAYVRKVLRPWRWTERRRKWWVRHGAAVEAGELLGRGKRRGPLRIARLV
jgi:hypothetical protein